MKKKLSILIYSLASGGAERVVSVLLDELKEKYEITLFLMNDTIFYDIPKNIKIIYLENSNPSESGIKKLLKLPVLAWKYKKLNDSDISVSFMNRSNYINIIAKILEFKSKVIISERAMPSLQHKNGVQGFINKFLIKRLYRKADIVIGNSKGNCRDLVNNFNIQEVKTIYNLIDLKIIKELSKECVNYRDEKFTFITIGRLDRGKNHKILIESMEDIDAKLYIIGDGELRDTLEKQIESLNLQNKVILLGKQSNPYKYLVQSDCFVFSSLYEGLPNVLLEALSCGLPIISTDCQSGPREILAPNSDLHFQIEDDIEISEYGVLTPLNDIKRLSTAMKLIINDEDLRNKYRNKAKNRASDFDIKKIIKKFEDVFDA
ncbi:glycosyl transferase group 1 [Arcobacter nitrofigilis DSM 7299]|uniref:Glycosyl transferase group 1 n=1 Tax=Arcobacter nitrofigilis (strain ATCC 33309 / DSM 7299 / CCUG 15893 / LMG 7604 / NCTC 12251 / CI) TaxID=572480 RepID=D5V6C4_ARCNC|nr:glycosyltransferase [Arcobacter nitrofigilis]ADG94194.1 glycosyl transferase group 1 [Arcobacter nitrofigilis DSM 7299]